MSDRGTIRQADKEQLYHLLVSLSPLLLVFALALGLRLLAWRWHEQYALGGDESEYFNQALTLLREHRYVELNLMRPPLYTGFLAACIFLFDSLVQRLRLVQAIISALTVVPVYLLTRRLFGRRRVALAAALLAALSYTLAAHASELLTETLFAFELTTLFWLLLLAGDKGGLEGRSLSKKRGSIFAFLAGLNLGGLVLLRSVALPLLPLGMLWLLLVRQPITDDPRPTDNINRRWGLVGRQWLVVLVFALGAVLVIAPWTIRNYRTYGALILVDTTGAENLWLDNNPAGSTPNDPLGREAAKQQLYALGDDRAARQRLASANGLAAIMSHPAWFVAKASGEAKKFFALDYFDDLRERRAIWVSPPEVWLRLLLGDGLWLLLLLAGTIGLWCAPATDQRRRATDRQQPSDVRQLVVDPRWIFVPWALYTLMTAMIFHVELRYRLPLYPVLIPYAAWALARIGRPETGRTKRVLLSSLSACLAGAALTCLVLLAITLLHRPYLGESWMLARKHYQLWLAERALGRADVTGAAAAANDALGIDPDSALARVALARAALARGDRALALAALDDAIAALRAHPQAHLLRAAILREQGNRAAARAEFAYEKDSLQDLQRWSWETFAPFESPPTALEVGKQLDLGYLRGFWLAEPGGFRWSRVESEVWLSAPQVQGAHLDISLNGQRQAGAPAPRVTILAGGKEVGRIAPGPGWQTYSFAIPAELIPGNRQLVVTLRSETFRPRDYDRASTDNRELGVMVRRVEVR